MNSNSVLESPHFFPCHNKCKISRWCSHYLLVNRNNIASISLAYGFISHRNLTWRSIVQIVRCYCHSEWECQKFLLGSHYGQRLLTSNTHGSSKPLPHASPNSPLVAGKEEGKGASVEAGRKERREGRRT